MRATLTALAVLACLLAASVLVSRAYAQAPAGASVVTTCGTPNITYAAGSTAPLTMNTSGVLCAPGGGGATSSVTVVPTAGTPTQAAVTCAATTTTLLAAAAASYFFLVQNPSTATTTIWVNVAGAAAVAAPPSISLTAGQSLYFPSATYLPNVLISCITTAGTQSVSITSK